MRLQSVKTALRRAALVLPLLCAVGWPVPASALTAREALQLIDGDMDTRIGTLMTLAASDDVRAQALIRALAAESVQRQGNHVLLVRDGAAVDAVDGQPVALTDAVEDVVLNNRFKGALDGALAGLDLHSSDPQRQQSAALTLQQSAFDDPNPAQLPLIEKALSATDSQALSAPARDALVLAQAALWLSSTDIAQRRAAATRLAQARLPVVKTLLAQRLAQESDPDVQSALRQSLDRVERALAISAALGQLFTGISLGSILLLAALGLAITYGLMGVINMAHGELIMVGAYATYAVQGVFRRYLPGAFDAYLIAALPVAFLSAALITDCP